MPAPDTCSANTEVLGVVSDPPKAEGGRRGSGQRLGCPQCGEHGAEQAWAGGGCGVPAIPGKCQAWVGAQQVGRSFPEGYSLGVAHGLHVSPSVFGGVSSGQSHLSSPETLLLFHWTRGGT